MTALCIDAAATLVSRRYLITDFMTRLILMSLGRMSLGRFRGLYPGRVHSYASKSSLDDSLACGAIEDDLQRNGE